MSLPVMKMLMSSAQAINFDSLVMLNTPLMYIKKSKGPKILPWGTPDEILPIVDEKSC